MLTKKNPSLTAFLWKEKPQVSGSNFSPTPHVNPYSIARYQLLRMQKTIENAHPSALNKTVTNAYGIIV